MEGEQRIEQGNGIPEYEVPLNAQINGDLSHEKQLEDELLEADGSWDGPSTASGEINGRTVREEEVRTLPGSPHAESSSPGIISGTAAVSMPEAISKGKGLRKWRRIKRDTSRDGGSIPDAGRILKRGLSITEPLKGKDESNQKDRLEDESSVASVDSSNVKNALSSPLTVKVLDTELELLASLGNFAVGIDSETSDDRSSRFSTAASGPRSKHEGFGHGKDKSRVKGFGGKGSGNAGQPRGRRGKGSGVDTTKKLREDQLVFEKENSHSSIECELRNSERFIAQKGSTTSNRRQNEGSVHYGGENQDPAQGSEEVQEDFYKENGDVEDSSISTSYADIFMTSKIEENENYPPQQEEDPFAESMILLQEAQEALEKELKQVIEIGLENTTLSGNSSGQRSHEETDGSSSAPLDLKVVMLSQKVEHLERELDEATSTAKAKEMRVMELEATSRQRDTPNMAEADVPQAIVEVVESELESLFREKVETEVAYLILSNALRKTMWKPFNLVGQECHGGGYEEVKVMQNVAEDKSTMLKRKLEELDASVQELSGTEVVLELHNGVLRSSLCFLIQVLLLLLAFALFLVQLLPPTADVVPT